MKKIKILYIVTDVGTAGGVMSIVSKKINYLVKYGYDVELMTIRKYDKLFFVLDNRCFIHNFDCKPSLLRNIIEFYRFLKKSSFNIIISADAQFVTWVLPFICNCKIILELHQSYDGVRDFIKEKYKSAWKCFFFSFLKKIAYPRYNKIVVLTEEDKKKWGYKKTLVIPNFHTCNSLKQSSVRKKVIVCLGRFHYQKGYDLLIEVWKLVCKHICGWKLYYYGAEISSETKQILKKMSAPSSFILKGYEKDLDNIFSEAYLNIVPSRSESFSLSIIEAMCYGVPTIAFDITGPRSIIATDKSGKLIKAYDIKKMADAIINYIEEPEIVENMRSTCILRAKDYERNLIMSKWITMFEALVNS